MTDRPVSRLRSGFPNVADGCDLDSQGAAFRHVL